MSIFRAAGGLGGGQGGVPQVLQHLHPGPGDSGHNNKLTSDSPPESI